MGLLNTIGKCSLRLNIPWPRQQMRGYLEWSLVRDVLRLYRVNCVLDVGANSGQFAQSLRRIGYTGHICSFEPVPDAFSALSARMAHDRFWHGYRWALGESDSQRVLHIATDSTAMSSFLAPISDAWRLEHRTVDMKRLDSVFGEVIDDLDVRNPCVYLKMDTQGYDNKVVEGAERCLHMITCLQSEVSILPTYCDMTSYHDVLRRYEEYGYVLYSLVEIARDPVQGGISEMNAVLVRPQTRLH